MTKKYLILYIVIFAVFVHGYGVGGYSVTVGAYNLSTSTNMTCNDTSWAIPEGWGNCPNSTNMYNTIESIYGTAEEHCSMGCSVWGQNCNEVIDWAITETGFDGVYNYVLWAYVNCMTVMGDPCRSLFYLAYDNNPLEPPAPPPPDPDSIIVDSMMDYYSNLCCVERNNSGLIYSNLYDCEDVGNYETAEPEIQTWIEEPCTGYQISITEGEYSDTLYAGTWTRSGVWSPGNVYNCVEFDTIVDGMSTTGIRINGELQCVFCECPDTVPDADTSINVTAEQDCNYKLSSEIVPFDEMGGVVDNGFLRIEWCDDNERLLPVAMKEVEKKERILGTVDYNAEIYHWVLDERPVVKIYSELDGRRWRFRVDCGQMPVGVYTGCKEIRYQKVHIKDTVLYGELDSLVDTLSVTLSGIETNEKLDTLISETKKSGGLLTRIRDGINNVRNGIENMWNNFLGLEIDTSGYVTDTWDTTSTIDTTGLQQAIDSILADSQSIKDAMLFDSLLLNESENPEICDSTWLPITMKWTPQDSVVTYLNICPYNIRGYMRPILIFIVIVVLGFEARRLMIKILG
jgi:hypothetical protein